MPREVVIGAAPTDIIEMCKDKYINVGNSVILGLIIRGIK